ncbi:galactose mutarotase [Antarcticibacterium arcticum]|uniref:Aldose 1-epimerase n=1 Tax=Antarcticibacterium arcticum TaxID=2585771 RepID=A0A5B8YM60_9FLAO|nr:aldose epimerase family protein [Antarcticibacterium arcticum]QED37713.1 galactose mutarotase [Antarcticibacterium arcticum]
MEELQKKVVGKTPEGAVIEQYTLTNSGGMQVAIFNYGGRIVSLKVPDKKGVSGNVVLGFEKTEGYLKENPFFGAIVGRYANRIARGEFTLDGEKFVLPRNNGQNHLHGGDKGFDKALWTGEKNKEAKNSLQLHYVSKHMEQGYPGNLRCTTTYTLHEDNSLEVIFEATTDKATIVNLTQHSYFNLSGDFSSNILDHDVEINAAKYLPVNPHIIPTGEMKSVLNSPFDFVEPKPVGRDITAVDEQLQLGLGYDHCWILNKEEKEFTFAASAYHAGSGRMLKVFTTEPGVQFYTGNFLDSTLPIPGGAGTYGKHSGLCFETQHYPDSPNQPEFPSVRLNPGEKYYSRTRFAFSVE